jgi:hypothetical protein
MTLHIGSGGTVTSYSSHSSITCTTGAIPPSIVAALSSVAGTGGLQRLLDTGGAQITGAAAVDVAPALQGGPTAY